MVDVLSSFYNMAEKDCTSSAIAGDPVLFCTIKVFVLLTLSCPKKINNTRLSYFKLAECPLGIFSSL